MPNFMTRALAGEIQDLDKEISDAIDRWHGESSGFRQERGLPVDVPLHEFLGMRWDEYRAWVEHPTSLPAVIARRTEEAAAKTATDAAIVLMVGETRNVVVLSCAGLIHDLSLNVGTWDSLDEVCMIVKALSITAAELVAAGVTWTEIKHFATRTFVGSDQSMFLRDELF